MHWILKYRLIMDLLYVQVHYGGTFDSNLDTLIAHGCGYLEDMREELREMYEYGIDEQFWVGSLEG